MGYLNHDAHNLSTQEAQNILLGQGGYEILSATTTDVTTGGHWVAITALTDNIKITVEDQGLDGDADTITVQPIAEGETIWLDAKAIVISKASGGGTSPIKAIAYRASKAVHA